MKILVVDDRPENRVLLQKQLEPFGHDVATAEDGAQALARARATHYDLIVSDLLMPVMDGYQLCYSIKTDATLQRTPVVLYTATYVTRKDEHLAKSLGADDLIGKPIEPDEFLERINTVVARSEGGKAGQIAPALDEREFLREYNGHLIQSLEDRLILLESNQSLKALNRELEKRVEQATRELQKSHDDLQSANRKLSAANREWESFSYTVSHDLRAPIRAISGFADVLREELHLAPDAEATRLLDRIERNANHMEQLIRDLLAYSRINTAAPPKSVALEPVVQAAVARLDDRIRARGAQVKIVTPLPAVIADVTALDRIVDNFLDNAVKFVPVGTTPAVEITATQEDGFITLSVRDNGPGIAAQHQERVFKIFERLPGSESVQGTGVGLAIVRKAAERMGGSCGVDSTLGQGSRFWIRLPAAPEA